MATPDIAYCPNHGVHEGHFVEPDPEDPHRWRSITWNCGTVTTPNKPPEPAGRVERARPPKETPVAETAAQRPICADCGHDHEGEPDTECCHQSGLTDLCPCPRLVTQEPMVTKTGRVLTDADVEQFAAEDEYEPREELTINALVGHAHDILVTLDVMDGEGLLLAENMPVRQRAAGGVLLGLLEQTRLKLRAAVDRFSEEQHEASERQRVAEEKS